jgi:hypothetical protein
MGTSPPRSIVEPGGRLALTSGCRSRPFQNAPRAVKSPFNSQVPRTGLGGFGT